MDGEIRYASTPGGARIAWAAYGEGPTVIACPSTTAVGHHLTHMPRPELPLAQVARLVFYDHAGAGRSSRDVYDYSLPGLVAELEAVADASTPDGVFALYAQSVTGPVAIAYAVTHPDHVSRLFMHNTWASGREYTQGPAFAEYRRAVGDSPPDVVGQMFARVAGDQRGEMAVRYAAAFLESVEPQVYIEYLDALPTHDVSELLGQITTPTVVAYSNTLTFPRRAMAERLAAAIPGAVLADEVSLWQTEAYLALMRRAVLGELDERGAINASTEAPTSEPRSYDLPHLSDREREVLRLVAAGHRNAAIANRLYLAPSTVARHVHNLLMKTGCDNRVELAAYAHRAGLTSEGEA